MTEPRRRWRDSLAPLPALVACALLTPLSETAMAAPSVDAELRSTLADQQGVAVTIYNEDLALVKDQRQVTLPAGAAALALRDVSARIMPQTALLRAADGGAPIEILEQNFDFDLLTPAKLLEKYVGREVGLIRTHPTTGEETEESALVLAASDGVVLRIGDRIETIGGGAGALPGRVVYRDIPANLRDRPTLVLRLEQPTAGARRVELSYLTGGLKWQADYVGELNATEDSLDLTGWVTLENRSGTTYRDARLQLVAGEVNRVEESPERPMMAMMDMARAAPAPPMAEESLFEYHLYSLARPTTIADNQSKQVALLSAAGVRATRALLIPGDQTVYRQPIGQVAQDLDVIAKLEFDNDIASNLGLPLPAGVVRIYKRDSAGNAQFIGEDRIDHTPKNESVSLTLGTAFDVTAKRRQLEFKKRTGSGPWQYEFETAVELRVKNAKSEAVRVTIQEPIPGDWTMLEESAPHDKANATLAVWQLPVPAEGEAVLSYRVRVRF